MKFFEFNKDSITQLPITEVDKEWVDDNFAWLIKAFGYPTRASEQLLFESKYFPKTFSSPEISIENLIHDFSLLLYLDASKIYFELQEDVRDLQGVPYIIEGELLDSQTYFAENGCKIFIAKSLLNRPKRLISCLAYEFMKIRLNESGQEYQANDTSLFIYLAAVCFRFGVLLVENLVDIGGADMAGWQERWNYISEMRSEVMAYALALHSKLIEQDHPAWEKKLPADIQATFVKSMKYLTDAPNALVYKNELIANDLFSQADKEYQNQKYEVAIATLEKILFLTNDQFLKMEVYNNLGYYQLRMNEVDKSILNFQKALEIDGNFGFAHDNLGYALIKKGSLEEGRKHLALAFESENNDEAYSYRNLALYYEAKGEMELAEEHFQLAFDGLTVPVDLLELHYGNFLINLGQNEKGREYLKMAVAKNEPEAIKQMNEL